MTAPRRERWRLDNTARGLTIPGVPCVRLVILCGPCWEARRAKRKLGVFEMDTGPDADRVLWYAPFHLPGNVPATGLPAVRGTGDAARVNLTCAVKTGRGGKSGGGCRHTPAVPLAWITAQFGEIWAEGASVVQEVPY